MPMCYVRPSATFTNMLDFRPLQSHSKVYPQRANQQLFGLAALFTPLSAAPASRVATNLPPVSTVPNIGAIEPFQFFATIDKLLIVF